MLSSALPHPLLPRGRLLAVVAWAIALALGGLIAPARGLASGTSWAPSAASLVKAPRGCPALDTAAYFDTTCWTVAPDTTSPFYSPTASYAWGQCTYWALELRPDLWNNRSPVDPDPSDWTAYTWPQHAALEGLTIDHAPAAGAVIVWPQTAGNDSGHVAYVQSVGVDSITGDDLVTVQEMNDTTFDDPAQGQGDTMTMSMDASELAQVQVIHAPGTSTGTVPAASAPAGPVSTTTSPTPPARATTTTTPPRLTRARRRPRLSVRIERHGVRVSSKSPAALHAAIFRMPSGALLRRSSPRSGSPLTLPRGRFKLCVSQAAIGAWSSDRVCVTAGRAGRR